MEVMAVPLAHPPSLSLKHASILLCGAYGDIIADPSGHRKYESSLRSKSLIYDGGISNRGGCDSPIKMQEGCGKR